MADSLATLQTRRDEAALALHRLAIGERVVTVERDGRKVTYGQANRGDLDAYLAGLDARIADLTLASTSALPRRRFIPVSFG